MQGDDRDHDQEPGDPAGDPGSGAPGRRWLLFPAGAVAALTLLALAELVDWASSDALLPALMSTERLTFYYWGQDRLANLVPLLAWPVRDVLASFYVQAAAVTAGTFAVIAQLGWFHLHVTGRRLSGPVLAAATGASGLALLGVLRGIPGYRLLVEQQHGLTLALALLGLRWFVADQRGRRAAGALLALAAVVVNPSWALVAPAGWLLCDDEGQRRRRTLESLLLGGVALAASTACAAAFGQGEDRAEQYNGFSPRTLVDGLPEVLRELRISVRADVLALLLVGAVAVLLLRRAALPARLRLTYVVAPAFALGWTLLFAGNPWVAANAHGSRYFFPVYVVVALVLVGAALELLAVAGDRLGGRASARPRAGAVLAVALAALAGISARRLVALHPPAALEAAAPVADLVIAEDVQLVAGSYWNVWPVVLVARDRGDDALGVTYRSDPLRADIRRVARSTPPGELRMACLAVPLRDCLADLERLSGQGWEVVETLVEQPLTVRLAPA